MPPVVFIGQKKGKFRRPALRFTLKHYIADILRSLWEIPVGQIINPLIYYRPMLRNVVKEKDLPGFYNQIYQDPMIICQSLKLSCSKIDSILIYTAIPKIKKIMETVL